MTQAERASDTTAGARIGESAFGRLQGAGQRRVVSGGDVGYHNDDEDGSSIMGRAANIAHTAKDLLGALWYGANPNTSAGDNGVIGESRDTSKKSAKHRRGVSMG
jgi:hypothetical protein